MENDSFNADLICFSTDRGNHFRLIQCSTDPCITYTCYHLCRYYPWYPNDGTSIFHFLWTTRYSWIYHPDFIAGIITLTLNASAYIAEIVRGGIKAVPVGQMEASRSLGLPYNRTMQKIILPQAIKIMLPSFVNQFVISLKDTTIISAIGVVELLQTGKIIVARTTQSTYVYLIIAIMYLILITALTKLAKVLEKKVK